MKNPAKSVYQIRNWREYNAALKKRGSLALWISQEAIDQWNSKETTGRRGAPDRYSDLAIETMAALQAVLSLPGRQTQGFLESIFERSNLKLTVPDHSTLSRRRARLQIELPVTEGTQARHLVVDSTGVKVYGEGEWKVRQHGWSKRRTWLKLHIAAGEATREILHVYVTTNDIDDGEALVDLLADVPETISQVSGDGAYDQRKCYDAIQKRNAKAVIPPRKGAKIWQRAKSGIEPHPRDENLRSIRKIGRKQWKKNSNYHRRSLAENVMYRFKTIFGDRLRTRAIKNQFKELLLKCAVLNRMTHHGMPESVVIAG